MLAEDLCVPRNQKGSNIADDGLGEANDTVRPSQVRCY